MAQSADFDRGVALFQKGKLDEAIPFLTRAVEANPRDAPASKALGVVYAARKQYELAEPAFRRACELDPRLEDACYYQGRALYALNRFEGSLAALDRAFHNWQVVLAIAQAQGALGRAAEAEKHFKQAMSLCREADPRPGVAYGLFLVREGRFAEAARPLSEVIGKFPANADAHIHLGRALAAQGKEEAALRHFEHAVAADPSSSQAHLLLAKAFVRAGRVEEAKPHFEAAAGAIE